MKRKLCSMLMGVFAVVLLMCASIQRNSDILQSVAAAELIQEELFSMIQQEVVVAEPGVSLSEAEIYDPNQAENESLLLDGEAVGMVTQKSIVDGVSYVSIRAMSLEFDETAQVNWDGETSTITVTTEHLDLSATVGQNYLIANGRYLYLPLGLQVVDGVTMVPLTVLAKAFDATVSWDSATGTISVTSGSGAILSGDEFYAINDGVLFWMSRIIFAESGSEVLEGKIAVGNVVMNRVYSPAYPDTVLGVISQKNQFSTYKSGALADRTPNAQSIIAAKLVMEGTVISGLETATHFDTGGSTWASKNKTCVAIIGGHKFYG